MELLLLGALAVVALVVSSAPASAAESGAAPSGGPELQDGAAGEPVARLPAAVASPVALIGFFVDLFKPDPSVPIPQEFIDEAIRPYVTAGLADGRVIEWIAAPDTVWGVPNRRTVRMAFVGDVLRYHGLDGSWNVTAAATQLDAMFAERLAAIEGGAL